MKRHSAFTLIELLVVLAIIITMLTFLVPYMKRAKNAADLVACQSNIRQITTGLSIYAQRYTDTAAIGYALGSTFPNGAIVAVSGSTSKSYTPNQSEYISRAPSQGSSSGGTTYLSWGLLREPHVNIGTGKIFNEPNTPSNANSNPNPAEYTVRPTVAWEWIADAKANPFNTNMKGWISTISNPDLQTDHLAGYARYREYIGSAIVSCANFNPNAHTMGTEDKCMNVGFGDTTIRKAVRGDYVMVSRSSDDNGGRRQVGGAPNFLNHTDAIKKMSTYDALHNNDQ